MHKISIPSIWGASLSTHGLGLAQTGTVYTAHITETGTLRRPRVQKQSRITCRRLSKSLNSRNPPNFMYIDFADCKFSKIKPQAEKMKARSELERWYEKVPAEESGRKGAASIEKTNKLKV